jgi:large subunit ribosomal protein L13
MKTFSIKKADITRSWHLIDASDATLGRISTVAASLLIGKGKPTFTSHMDGGDFVVIINADNLKVTGNKLQQKTYYRHSGFPGGISQRSLQDVMDKNASEAIRMSVRGMLPVNKLRPGRLERLKIYNGPEHNHNAQQPNPIDLKKASK